MMKTKGDGDGDGRHSQGITTTSKAPYYTQEGVREDVPGKVGVSREIASSGGTSSKEVTTTGSSGSGHNTNSGMGLLEGDNKNSRNQTSTVQYLVGENPSEWPPLSGTQALELKNDYQGSDPAH